MKYTVRMVEDLPPIRSISFRLLNLNATDYAKARGVAAGKDSDANWWLRDPGAITYMLGVNRAGVVTEGGFSVHDMTEGVRPVLRVPSSALQKVEVQTNK